MANIALLGSHGSGKTTLINRYFNNIFIGKYTSSYCSNNRYIYTHNFHKDRLIIIYLILKYLLYNTAVNLYKSLVYYNILILLVENNLLDLNNYYEMDTKIILYSVSLGIEYITYISDSDLIKLRLFLYLYILQLV